MKTGRLVAAVLAVPLLFTTARAQAPRPLPVLDEKPVPQVDAGGPSAAVLSLAFSADGETLYAAGLDKVVRVWTMRQGNFVLKTTYRVPIGPGNLGAINAVALSPDGKWLAMAGRAPIRGESGFRLSGVIVGSGALSADQNRDAGVIYVANTANPAGGKVLRGHEGEVRALAFAPFQQGNPPLLVSAASERHGDHRFGGLRLWDVESGKLLAQRTDDLPATESRPGLAVWHTGAGTAQVRVAVAWPEKDNKKDSYLRLWDASPGAVPLQGWVDDHFTQTVALLSQDNGARLLTGGFGNQAGRLQVWNLSADREAVPRLGATLLFPKRGQDHFLPVSMSLVSARGGPPSHAAVVVLPFGGPRSAGADFRIVLVDLRTNQIVVDVPLPDSDKTHIPAIAARDRYLAVSQNHAVSVYAVADLLASRLAPKATLVGEGLSLRQVAFVDRGRGLWLSDDRKDLVLDFEKRALRDNKGGTLAKDTPGLDDWSYITAPDRKSVRVRHGQKDLPNVRLRKDEEITAVALRPPAPGRPAVLAVAYTEPKADRTLIMLCDPADGKPYRLLIGHLQRVNQLAFSASRQLLASVADDETVCIWSLADLDRAVGQILGLDVTDEGQKVVARAVEPESPAAKAGLAAGDVLEKLAVAGAKAEPVQSATDFALAISLRHPGDEVEVTVAGKGPVKLPIGRGVDERKPLFSLFLLRGPALPGWIGWSPAGPYDCSGPAAEKHLGWQTNTGDPAAPVSYAAVVEYRKDYYRQGILRYLAAEADPGRALQKWNEAHPTQKQVFLWFLRPEGALPTERADEYLVRQAVKSLRIGINEDYPLDDHHVLRWRLTRIDGGKINADHAVLLGQATRDKEQWQADLAGVDWRRGEFQLRVGLHARPEGRELASETVMLRFQPPAPALALRSGNQVVKSTEQQPLVVKSDKLALQIDMQAPVGQKVIVEFTQTLNGLPEKGASAAIIKDAGLFEQDFKLQEGLNHITIRAINQGALPDHEEEESVADEAWVRYKVPDELPPRITALRVEPKPELKHQNGEEVWVVNRSTIHLTGKIEAEGILAKAAWSAGGPPNALKLPNKARGMDFDFHLELKAGQAVPLKLQAKSQRSPEKTVEYQVVYWPPLPVVAMDPLNSPEVFQQKLPLTGTFKAETTDPFDLVLQVSSPEGKKCSFKPQLDRDAKTWKAELSLLPGENRVETLVTNKWRGERAGDSAFKLYYRRPPQITEAAKSVDAVETNKVSLAITVEGPAGQPLTAITADRNPVPFKAGKPEVRGERWIWKKVELPEVLVNDGDHNLNRVSIRALTEEGESRAAVVRVVHKNIPRPPSARFLGPAVDAVQRPEYTAAFRVDSQRPLQRIEIRRGPDLLYHADLTKVEPEGRQVGRFAKPSHYVWQGKARLKLTKGTNRLELVAVNTDDRSRREEIVVSYVPSPGFISIDEVKVLAGDAVQQVLKPTYGPNGDVSFPEVPRNLVLLTGRVSWMDPEAKALDNPRLEVVVKVGDCRQLPVALDRRGKGDEANVRRFHVPLVLIGSQNRIKIELPTVSQQELSRREFDLACAAPERKQRLHVLIVGVNVKDAEELKNRVLDALAVDRKDRPKGAQGVFVKKPPFDWCNLYHVLAGEVTCGKVLAQLADINNEIRRLKTNEGWLNDVVLIYYQGEDVPVPAKGERWLKTSLNYRYEQAPLQAFAIPCHALPRVPGVELLLLNVAAAPGAFASGSDWGGDPDAGLLRYTCQNPDEVRRADPPLLTLLQQAIRKKGRLGEVVQYVNTLLGQQRGRPPLLIVLDEDQLRRQIGGP
jgi:WD40 repeat protein